MNNNQSEALRLADEICNYARYGYETEQAAQKRRMQAHKEAAAELRRLHEENSKLRREVGAISANAVDDGRKIDKLEAQLGEAVWNYGEVKRVNALLMEALELAVLQNDHDMVMTGEELRMARAALARAKGEA